MPLASIMRTWLFRASVMYTSPLGAKLRPRGLLNCESVADTASVPGPPCWKLTVFPPMVVMVPAGPVGLGTAWADCMAARPVPPAMSAATSAATPRAGRSRRFEDGYDILCVLQGARGCQGGTSGYCRGHRGGCAAVAGGTNGGDRGRPATSVGLGMGYERSPLDSCFCNVTLRFPAAGGPS